MSYIGSGAAPKATALDNDTVETTDIKDGAVTAGKMATGAAASNLGSYVSQVNGQSGSVTVEIPPSFASGTSMLFTQTAAPTGWTKSTTHNNKALRVVSGTAGSGGSVDFTTAFASQTPAGTVSVAGLSVGSTTLTTAQMPSHSHGLNFEGSNPGNARLVNGDADTNTRSTGSAGGGGSHNHSLSGSASFTGTAINLAVKYVDVIRATKD
jgi:hypothetical protein